MAEEAFLQLIQDNKLLYDKSDKDFKNAKLKDAHWEKIGSVFHITGKEAQLKFKVLRQKYVREKNIEQSESRSGAGCSKRSKWHLMPLLEFLNEHIKPRKTSSNLSLQMFPELGCEEDSFTNTWVEQVNVLEESLVEDDDEENIVLASSSSGISWDKESPHPHREPATKRSQTKKSTTESPLLLEPVRKKTKKTNDTLDDQVLAAVNKITNSLDNDNEVDNVKPHIKAFGTYVTEQLNRMSEKDSDYLIAKMTVLISEKILQNHEN